MHAQAEKDVDAFDNVFETKPSKSIFRYVLIPVGVAFYSGVSRGDVKGLRDRGDTRGRQSRIALRCIKSDASSDGLIAASQIADRRFSKVKGVHKQPMDVR